MLSQDLAKIAIPRIAMLKEKKKKQCLFSLVKGTVDTSLASQIDVRHLSRKHRLRV